MGLGLSSFQSLTSTAHSEGHHYHLKLTFALSLCKYPTLTSHCNLIGFSRTLHTFGISIVTITANFSASEINYHLNPLVQSPRCGGVHVIISKCNHSLMVNILKRKLSHFSIFSSSHVVDAENLPGKHCEKKVFYIVILIMAEFFHILSKRRELHA